MYCYGYKSGWNYPKRDCAMLISGEDMPSAEYQPLITYYDLLVTKHFKWNNIGVVVAKGVDEPSDVISNPAFGEAEALGRDYK